MQLVEVWARQVGSALWLLYVAAFAFYLYCRSTTVGLWAAPALLAYQIVVLVAEGLVFTSNAIIGLSQARQLHAQNRRDIIPTMLIKCVK